MAQCLESEDLGFLTRPSFGSWVISLDEESGSKIFGIITAVTTAPIDSIHRSRALGLSLRDLREQQSQVFAMLKTEFQTAIVGFATVESIEKKRSPRTGQLERIFKILATPSAPYSP